MKKYLFLVTLLLSLLQVQAQDKQLLARVAYEEAEKAFESGKLSTAYEELKKVDEYLGKATPKVQFLRVQIWKTWAEEDGQYFENAIRNSKTYLDMAKSFDIPEEKILEVTRWLVKLEKDKVAYEKAKVESDKVKKLDAIRKEKAIAFIDSIRKVFHFTPHMTEAAFLNHYGEATKKMKRTKASGNVFYDTGFPKGEGLADVGFAGGKILDFTYTIKFHKTDNGAVRAYYDALVNHMKASFPKDALHIRANAITLLTGESNPLSMVSFLYFESAKSIKTAFVKVILYNGAGQE